MADPKISQQSLQTFTRQYFQLLEPSEIIWPPGGLLKDWDVQTRLFEKMFDESKIQYLPPAQYQLRILKRLVGILEDSIADPEEDGISDDLMSTLARLVSLKLPSEAEAAQEKAYVTYCFPREGLSLLHEYERPVTLLESRAIISGSGTTGLRTWEAALHLAKFLTTDEGKSFIHEKTILELGAGTGLLSILCAKYLKAKRVVATDGVEIVVDAINTSIFLNTLDGNEPRIGSAALKWGYYLTEKSLEEDYAVADLDVVVGADVTYDTTVVPVLVSTMRQLFELRPKLQILIAATVRNESTVQVFIRTCGQRGFRLRDVSFDPPVTEQQRGPFYSTSVPIRILHITSSSADDRAT